MHHVVQAQVARLELQRIDVDLNLAVGSAVRLRHRRALNVGDLVAHLKLRQILEPVSFSPWPFSVTRQTGCVDAVMPSTTGGSVPGGRRRRSAIARLAMLLNAAFGIGARLEINLDQAYAGQRTRFAVVHVGGQRKEALKGIGDVRFNLLRRHAAVKRGHHHHRHVDFGEKVHRHARSVDHSHQANHQAQHDDEVRET